MSIDIGKIEVRHISKGQIREAALFISKINCIREQHIGYCGTQADEIEDSIKEIYDDADDKCCFIAVLKNDNIIGVIGFEPDEDSGIAEIWGPFISSNDWNIIADMLWSGIIKIMPDNINEFHAFYNYYNSKCIDFAYDHGFVKDSEWFILTFSKTSMPVLHQIHVEKLKQEYFNEFIGLHDTIFPNTYYSGKQIIEKIGEEKQVFAAVEKGKMAGYVYVEANSDFNEGNIEFLGVNADYRRKGYGEELVLEALVWLVEDKNIKKITLSVNSVNMGAIRIYKRAGFNEDNHTIFLKTNMTTNK